MTTNPDIAARLLEAYDNMGTATREDLKEAADTINNLRARAASGTSLVIALIRAVTEATGETPQAIIDRSGWTLE